MTNSLQLRIAAAGLVIGPLLFSIGDPFRRIVEPSGTFSDKQLSDAVAHRPSLWAAAALLNVLASIFFLPGVLALFATARGRGIGMTATGAAMLGIGLVASVGHTVGYSSALTPRRSSPQPGRHAPTSHSCGSMAPRFLTTLKVPPWDCAMYMFNRTWCCPGTISAGPPGP